VKKVERTKTAGGKRYVDEALDDVSSPLILNAVPDTEVLNECNQKKSTPPSTLQLVAIPMYL
jgi:hypothetical protein